jgi:hypothetical protein
MSQQNKSTSSSITNAFSFEEVINIFTGIDNKIISLHECSSEDFLGLNKQFRRFHAESKTISDNAQTVLDVITRDKTLQALRNLKILKEQLKTQIRHVECFLAETGNLIYTTISGIDHTLLSLRNLRQNLMTIKFLIANLKLEASYNNPFYNGKDKTIPDVFSSIEAVISEIHRTEAVLLDINTILIENKGKVKNLSEENYGALENSFLVITSKINKLVEIRQSALSAIPRLKQITEDCRDNVSQIITNLQYHDIIKQKIDHIQLTHRNLVNELDDLKKSTDEKGKRHSYAKFFLKIRDIAGLQAAQLIHANKAYQNAIKEITTSLTSTGESMSDISQLCNQFVSKPELFDILNENDLQSQLEELSSRVNQDKDHIEELSGSITLALENINTLHSGLPAWKDSAFELINDLKNITGQFQESNKNENQQVVNQINTLIGESAGLCLNIVECIDMESRNLLSVHTIQSTFVAGRSVYLNRLYSTTDDLLSARGKSIAEQLSTLQENIREGSNITMAIRKSVDQVRYYDFFENVIEEVIAELNNINYKLRFIESDNKAKDKDENLEHLRNQYTMESEHKIHDSYSRKNIASIAITSVEIDQTIDEEEDNLELF